MIGIVGGIAAAGTGIVVERIETAEEIGIAAVVAGIAAAENIADTVDTAADSGSD